MVGAENESAFCGDIFRAFHFEYLKVDAVWCGYFDGNEKSRRCQEKCGFRYHHSDEVAVEKLAEKRLEHFTRLTRAEWEERNSGEE